MSISTYTKYAFWLIMKSFSLAFSLFLFSGILFANSSANVVIGEFSSGRLNHWESKVFSGSTDYQIFQLDDVKVLKAVSHSSASGLFKEQRVDLLKTPYLNWRWRIDNRLSDNNDEQQKSGDDFSARVYVVVSGGWTFWNTKALNYVWTNHSAKGMVWPNAFSGDKAMMIAVRSSVDNTHTWFQEKRNIIHDLKQQFGADIRYIDAIAVMTDTDNTQGHAIAYYGDIFFSAE